MAIRAAADLPDEVTSNPAEVKGMHRRYLPTLRPLSRRSSRRMRLQRVLGDDIVQAVLAVRRFELDHYGDTPADELPERFRFAWSI